MRTRLRRSLVLVALLTASASAARAQTPARRPAPAAPAGPDSAARRTALYWPTDPYWSTRAPDTAVVDIETTRGTITVVLKRAWAPRGVDRFYNLARAGYFDDSRFYRVVDGFVAQFGLAGDPAVATVWSHERLPVDPRRASNERGTLTYAQFKPDDRTTSVFINLTDNARLDELGFSPIGRVVKGLAAADRLFSGYGERPMAEANTKRVYSEANKFFDARYPKLDRIRRVKVRER